MYIVLSGGFYGLSHKQEIWGFTPIKLGDAHRGVDFILKIDGLPEELTKPEGIKVHYKYFCKKCKSFVPEWDMERKQGCFFHDPEPTREESPEWRIGVMEEYKQSSKPWIKNAVRIWLDIQPGQEKWIAIKRFIEHNYSTTKNIADVTPKPVGTRTEWLIEENEVPFVDLVKNVSHETTPMTTSEVTDTLLKRIVELENRLKKAEEVKIETKEETIGIPEPSKTEPAKIEEVEVPSIYEYKPVPKPEPVKQEFEPIPEHMADKFVRCEICGKLCKKGLGITSHKRFNHKDV